MTMGPGRKLKINFEDFKFALNTRPGELHHYLDSQSGEVLWISDETRDQLESILEKLDEDATLEMTLDAIQQENVDDEVKIFLQEAAHIEFGCETRYLEIPQTESWVAYQDMESFIETVTPERLRLQLEAAIQGRGAFRRFKDVLAAHLSERERWFKFEDECIRHRAENWLFAENIEPNWCER